MMAKRAHGWALGLGLALTAAGCSDEEPDMTGWAGGVAAHVDAIRADEADHRAAMDSAMTLDAMRGIEAGHRDDFAGHVDAMSSMMEDMGTMCSHMHSGAMPDLEEMRAMMDEALAESRAHAAAMVAAADTMAARAEEARHHDAMATMLDRMDSGADSMMASAGTYRCRMECCR
jgi:hypothetical protein